MAAIIVLMANRLANPDLRSSKSFEGITDLWIQRQSLRRSFFPVELF
jgi:hypothetical protein